MRCDVESRNQGGTKDKVSIPAGFSDALRPDCGLGMYEQDITVSIPAGFSDALRPDYVFDEFGLVVFQSLLGFLMRCDCLCLIDVQICALVSIPAGFSDALRLNPRHCSATGVVSIPAGFSDALRQGTDITDLKLEVKFQSLLGFLMRCDPESEGL